MTAGTRCEAIRTAAVLAAAIALLAFTAPARSADAGEPEDAFGRDMIVVEASAAACYDFDVYLALTGPQQRRGLMHVRSLPAFTGMLFVYPESGRRSMWMKNTYIPLDILFIRADGSVSSIAQDTEPLSLRSVASVEPVNYVLELNAGVSDALHIDEQSRVLLPAHLSTTE